MSHLYRFHSHLSQNKLHCTRQRDALFEAVLRYQPVSQKVLLKKLAGSLSRSSLFRLLKEFEAADIIVRSHDGLTSLSDRFSQHHHFRICRVCHTRAGFWDEALEKALVRYATKAGFVLEDHNLELTGLCRTCQPDSQPRPAIGLNFRRTPGRL